MAYLISSQYKLDKIKNELIITDLKSKQKFYVIGLVKDDFNEVCEQQLIDAHSTLSVYIKSMNDKKISAQEKDKFVMEILRKKSSSAIKKMIKSRIIMENAFDELENMLTQDKFIFMIQLDETFCYSDLNDENMIVDITFCARDKLLLPITNLKKI